MYGCIEAGIIGIEGKAMFELFNTGIIVGVLVSSPMGPIGMLCVQRTLAKGRKSGFVSGIGAAFSDLIYAAITGLFMGLVVNFVEAHQRPLQIFGSAVMAVFGYYIFRNNPVKSLQRNQEQKQTLVQDLATAFFLTFSNVLIVFLYIGLYAHFGFVLPEHSIQMTITGLIGVFTGAVLWWLFITFVISLLRRWFNIRGLKLMNRIVGSVIIVLAVFGLISSICSIR
ncbi:MAG: LysE family transporter [Tannerella sp.]|jgi:threonine/homoserine/homoserine lactone efflux protein|nr:LysE family transporter [Tannerella sp.]